MHGRLRQLLQIVLVAVLVTIPATAHARMLDPQDAIDLAQTLADVGDDQDVCYQWNVTIRGGSGDEVGSSQNPDGPITDPAACTGGIATFTASLTYTCSSCEAEDSIGSRRLELTGDLAGAFTMRDVDRVSKAGGSALLGNSDDLALRNTMMAIGQLVNDSGRVPRAAFEPSTSGAGTSDGPDRIRRSDWVRINTPTILTAIALVGIAAFLVGYALRRLRADTE